MDISQIFKHNKFIIITYKKDSKSYLLDILENFYIYTDFKKLKKDMENNKNQSFIIDYKHIPRNFTFNDNNDNRIIILLPGYNNFPNNRYHKYILSFDAVYGYDHLANFNELKCLKNRHGDMENINLRKHILKLKLKKLKLNKKIKNNIKK